MKVSMRRASLAGRYCVTSKSLTSPAICAGNEEASKRVGQLPKHEHYFFPSQYNNHPGDNPITYFGFDPSVTREEIRKRLELFDKGLDWLKTQPGIDPARIAVMGASKGAEAALAALETANLMKNIRSANGAQE